MADEGKRAPTNECADEQANKLLFPPPGLKVSFFHLRRFAFVYMVSIMEYGI